MEQKSRESELSGLDRHSTALLVIDMQKDFADDHGFFGLAGSDLREIQKTIPRISRMISFFRESGMPVIHVITLHHEYTSSALWKSRSQDMFQGNGICVPGTSGAEVVDGIRPEAGEPVVVKHRYDAFLNTDLETILRALNVRNVAIAGNKTNVCVDTTARSAYIRDYGTYVLSDCVASDSMRMHEYALENFSSSFGVVTDSDSVINALRGESQD